MRSSETAGAQPLLPSLKFFTLQLQASFSSSPKDFQVCMYSHTSEKCNTEKLTLPALSH